MDIYNIGAISVVPTYQIVGQFQQFIDKREVLSYWFCNRSEPVLVRLKGGSSKSNIYNERKGRIVNSVK